VTNAHKDAFSSSFSFPGWIFSCSSVMMNKIPLLAY
jgi:hypothetical protein